LIGANPILLDERIDETQLSPDARAIWDETQSEIDRNRESNVERLWPRLIDAAPGFIDGQLITADYLIDGNEEDLVIPQLEELATRFPNDAEIARIHVKALQEDRQRLEASIAARQFAIANPDHPDAAEFNQLADDYMSSFRRVLRERIALQGIGSVAIGVLTGRTSTAVFDGLQLVQLMAMGESGIGDFVANQVKQQSKIITDPEAVTYINNLGQQVAQRMGRDEFEYEFYIIEDDSLNAFALPGGKVFVNTGALAAANTEAELLGLLGHEVAHAVLSHGFKRIVRGQLIASLAREIPLGSVLYNLVSLDYSRDHERQSDIIGTRVLANTGHAADGLRNFMATLGDANPQRVPQYLSTHPAPASRVQYLEELVVRNGYNRYSFEGVENLARIQARLGLPEHKNKD
jgi:predicted Zn-dependent protease